MRPKIRVVLATLLLTAGGCSGGTDSADESSNPSVPPPPPPPPTGNVTLTLTAQDMFGAPVAGASVELLYSSETAGVRQIGSVTDADGKLEVVGNFKGGYAVLVSAAELFGSSYKFDHVDDDRLDFAVSLHPSSALTPGIGALSVTGHSADGRQLEFSARLYVIEGRVSEGGDFVDWNLGAVTVIPCSPDNGNDGTTFTADCVEGGAGSDAGYAGTTLSKTWVHPSPVADPLSIGLLLDQGASLAVTDPANRRLLGAKYVQTRLDSNDQVALAAFATDDVGTGEVALLPVKPLTIFPVDAPAFTSDGQGYFATIDSLANLEGGASPLHEALGELIDFTASAAPADSRKAVVVLASGGVGNCSTPAACKANQDSLREKSESSGVSIVAVGLSSTSGATDRKKLGTWAQSQQGSVFWAQDAAQVPTIFGRVPEILDGRHGALDVMVRLESPVVGAFASGSTIVGTLEIEVCPWDCSDAVHVPFALRVP
jgi:hypothetical protein